MHKMLLQAADRSGDTQHELHVERAAWLLYQRPGQDALETTSAAAEGPVGHTPPIPGQVMIKDCTQGLLRARDHG